jgi:hypothetical protein
MHRVSSVFGRLYRPYLLHLLWSRRSSTPRFKSVLSLQPIIKCSLIPFHELNADYPTGQISERSAHGRTVSLANAPTNPLREKTNFASRFNVIWAVQLARRKYSASHFSQISFLYAHPASSKRGVRVVTIRGVRVAVDARRPRARGIAGRSQASSWGS